VRAALRGLADVGDDRADNVVAALTDHPDPRVRQAAVRATPTTSLGINRAESLRRRMDPRHEPDPAVREEAWQALLTLLPRGPADQLAAWPDRFSDDPPRRKAVLRLLADRAEDRGDLREVAHRRQQIGELLADAEQWDEAAVELGRALELTRADDAAPAMVLLGRSRLMMNALLQAGQYDEAATLGGSLIEADPSYRGDVGGWLRMEADRLVQAGQLADADRLVTAALAMRPPLDARFVSQLRETAQKIEQRRRTGGHRRVPPIITTRLDVSG
jgi:tetratricopeptide (TPR) repeat protein